jgi:hypothetical protein
MQKVEGSSPFIRSEKGPLRGFCAELGDDREHAAVRASVKGQAELSEDHRSDVGLHGLLHEPEHREVIRSWKPSA